MSEVVKSKRLSEDKQNKLDNLAITFANYNGFTIGHAYSILVSVLESPESARKTPPCLK